MSNTMDNDFVLSAEELKDGFISAEITGSLIALRADGKSTEPAVEVKVVSSPGLKFQGVDPDDFVQTLVDDLRGLRFTCVVANLNSDNVIYVFVTDCSVQAEQVRTKLATKTGCMVLPGITNLTVCTPDGKLVWLSCQKSVSNVRSNRTGKRTINCVGAATPIGGASTRAVEVRSRSGEVLWTFEVDTTERLKKHPGAPWRIIFPPPPSYVELNEPNSVGWWFDPTESIRVEWSDLRESIRVDWFDKWGRIDRYGRGDRVRNLSPDAYVLARFRDSTRPVCVSDCAF